MPNDKIQRRIPVVSSDDRRIGFANLPDENNGRSGYMHESRLRIRSSDP